MHSFTHSYAIYIWVFWTALCYKWALPCGRFGSA